MIPVPALQCCNSTQAICFHGVHSITIEVVGRYHSRLSDTVGSELQIELTYTGSDRIPVHTDLVRLRAFIRISQDMDVQDLLLV